MLSVVVPFAVLIVVIVCKKIPYIGGKVPFALLIAGLLTLLLSGNFLNPSVWYASIEEGLDRFLWLMLFTNVVNIYAQAQMELGIIEGVMRMLRAVFGNSKRALLASTFIAMIFIGAFTGSTSSGATIVGLFVAKTLYDMGLKAEEVAATIVMGATCGSVMPPISNCFNAASAISKVDILPVLNTGYIIAFGGALFCLIYIIIAFGGKKKVVAENGMMLETTDFIVPGAPREKIGDIFKEYRIKFIPFFLLITIIFLNSVFKINITAMTVGLLVKPLVGVRVWGGFTHFLVLTFFLVGLISFLYKDVRKNAKDVVYQGAKRAAISFFILAGAAFMVGTFLKTGQVELVMEFTSGLNANALKLGGAAAIVGVGMVTGSDNTPINVIFTFLFPALVAVGVDPIKATISAGALATAGQGAPPADIITFIVCGMLVALLNVKKIDPIKVMMLNIPMCLYYLGVGLLFLYI